MPCIAPSLNVFSLKTRATSYSIRINGAKLSVVLEWRVKSRFDKRIGGKISNLLIDSRVLHLTRKFESGPSCSLLTFLILIISNLLIQTVVTSFICVFVPSNIRVLVNKGRIVANTPHLEERSVSPNRQRSKFQGKHERRCIWCTPVLTD